MSDSWKRAAVNVALAAAVGLTGAAYGCVFEDKTPPAVTFNPVTEYANKLSFSADYISILEPLGEDGSLGYCDRELIEELYRFTNEMQYDIKTQSIIKDIAEDGEVTGDELNRFMDADHDGVSNRIELLFYQTDPLVAEKWDDFDSVTRILNTPDKLATYIQWNFTYASDIELYGFKQRRATPEEMFQKKKGDCEDFAIFGAYVLSQNGFELNKFNSYEQNSVAVLLIYWPKKNGYEGHAIILYTDEKEGRVFNCIEVDGRKFTGFNTIEEIARGTHPLWERYTILDYKWNVLRTVWRHSVTD